MDDISKLLQEAKPLYFARKQRRRRIKAVVSGLACALLIWFLLPANPPALQTYGEWMDEQIFQTANGSVIEDMGLPVDEYGLLKVI